MTWQPPNGAEIGAQRVGLARRRLALARWTQMLLLLAVGFGLAVGALIGLDWLVWIALVLAMLWVFLVVRSARLLRRVREAWGALQIGRPDMAEARALEALQAPTLLRPVTHSALMVLAAAAAKQARHEEAAQLAAFVLSRGERLLVGDRAGAQMLLAESLLVMGQLQGARAAMMPLYAMRLSLNDAVRLLLLQLRLEAQLGAYGSMLDRLGAKIDMADLLPGPESAIAQALLGLAARRSGLIDWAQWLWRRVNLLADWATLGAREPVLAGLGAGFAPIDAPAKSSAAGEHPLDEASPAGS